MMKKEPRSDERFVTRCAIADNILRYSFRLDRPDLSKRPKEKDALIDWAVKEAYAMFEPLVGDRIAKPFGVGCLPPLLWKRSSTKLFRRKCDCAALLPASRNYWGGKPGQCV